MEPKNLLERLERMIHIAHETNCILTKIATPDAEKILELLKEQEPVKAVADGEDSYMCNNCGTVIGWAEWEPGGIEEVKYKFCPECGRAVKWECTAE